jgi:hypothetical protein
MYVLGGCRFGAARRSGEVFVLVRDVIVLSVRGTGSERRG